MRHIEEMVGEKILKELSCENLEKIKDLIAQSGDENLFDSFLSCQTIISTARSRKNDLSKRCENPGIEADDLLQEAVEAANWWVKFLQDAGEDNPLPNEDLLIMSALTKAYRRKNKEFLSNEQIQDFRKALAFIIQELILNSERWKSWEKAKENPNFGRYLRVLEVDYEPCPELRAAWQSAGGYIHAQPFPIKTMMWISPGMIEARLGYRGKTEVIWTA